MNINTTSNYISNIDISFPSSNNDNSSQGFRDNFSNIKKALISANSDVSSLTKTLVDTLIDNSFNNNIIKRASFQNCSQIIVDKTSTPTSGPVTVDFSQGSIQYFLFLSGEVNFTFINWPATGKTGVLFLICNTVGTDTDVLFPTNTTTVGIDTRLPERILKTVIFQVWSSDNGSTIYVYRLGNVDAIVASANELIAYNKINLGNMSFTTSTETSIAGDTVTHDAIIVKPNDLEIYGKLLMIPNRIRTLVTGTNTELSKPYSTVYISTLTTGIALGASLRISTTSTVYSVGDIPSKTELKIFPRLRDTSWVSTGDILTFENPLYTDQPKLATAAVDPITDPISNDSGRVGAYTVRQGEMFATTSTFYYAFKDGNGYNPNYFQVSSDDARKTLPPGTTATTISTATSSTVIATTAYAVDLIDYYFTGGFLLSTAAAADMLLARLHGTIAMWAGSAEELPQTWVLCDGNSGNPINGITIPDLRSKFVVGSGGTYNTGDTGGSNSVILTTNQIPSHNHTITEPNSGAGHAHNFRGVEAPSGSGDGDRESVTLTRTTDGLVKTSITINNAGGGAAHENRPPFYALAYIINVGLQS